ncbi:MAG TPA: ACP S-malonyltransferase [Candidatus Syntrophosphaera sp.]|jgi:[acyl-carrier-protein] S-malonyltransferase|nr:ACP S-malonyltransferase [Candidatus Cloacimonadota bacterium]HOR02868.1 ACP S-malonyltransferase [Candidatus Syntrophosphaera sp.]HOU71831.1 ACP S-malonyltransferase [Candidatus Syntrophosphaera sp.]HPB43229.1 ACP S-malonyltransferase [Candidatus Syntrophosphaera sp.]HQG94565.1 ACP S-malonyltransferase [Candidatus Syntrophosphaera sp.]
MKTAFVFPGQGAQYVGMARDFCEAVPEFAIELEAFDRCHGTDLRQIMFEGPEELLKETRHTQPAILFHSICALKVFERHTNIRPACVAGHSLGEFSALVANGTLDWQDALHLVHKRGEFMIEANAGSPFAMAAVIGLEAQAVIEACAEAEAEGLVRAVNFNTPIQTVISGTEAGVAKAREILSAKGAKRVLPLVVGGPFHTPLIEKASHWLEEEMARVEFSDAEIPVISNVDAAPAIEGSVSRVKLVRQVVSPVLWVDSVKAMLASGITRFIEFGPQKVLRGMIKNIDKEAKVLNFGRMEELDDLLSAL